MGMGEYLADPVGAILELPMLPIELPIELEALMMLARGLFVAEAIGLDAGLPMRLFTGVVPIGVPCISGVPSGVSLGVPLGEPIGVPIGVPIGGVPAGVPLVGECVLDPVGVPL